MGQPIGKALDKLAIYFHKSTDPMLCKSAGPEKQHHMSVIHSRHTTYYPQNRTYRIYLHKWAAPWKEMPQHRGEDKACVWSPLALVKIELCRTTEPQLLWASARWRSRWRTHALRPIPNTPTAILTGSQPAGLLTRGRQDLHEIYIHRRDVGAHWSPESSLVPWGRS